MHGGYPQLTDQGDQQALAAVSLLPGWLSSRLNVVSGIGLLVGHSIQTAPARTAAATRFISQREVILHLPGELGSV